MTDIIINKEDLEMFLEGLESEENLFDHPKYEKVVTKYYVTKNSVQSIDEWHFHDGETYKEENRYDHLGYQEID